LDAGFAEVLAKIQRLYSSLSIPRGWIVVTSIRLDEHTMVFVLETLISNQNDEKFVCSKSRWTGGNIGFYAVSSLWKVALSTDGR